MKQKTFFRKTVMSLKHSSKEHPEQRIVYSDINVDSLIMKTKREMYEREEQEHEQDRQCTDDFIPASGVPF